MTLGERLRQARKRKGLKMTDVVNIVGVSQSYLSKIELGKRQNPSWDLLNDLAQLYEVDLKGLLDGIKESQEKSVLHFKGKKEIIVELLDKLDERDLNRVLTIVEAFVKEGEADT